MKIDIPRLFPWKQPNNGDLEGSVWSSRNLDFNREPGFVYPSYKMIVTTTSSELDNPQDLVTAFCKEQGTVNSFARVRWWALGNNSIYESTTENGDFNEDDSGTLPTITDSKRDGDIKAFNGRVYVAWDSNLQRRASATYTNVSSSLTSSYKILENYSDRLYIASDDRIDSIDTAEVLGTTTYTLDIATAANENLSISCMRKTSNGLWIGTYNNQGGRAKMLFWNGVTQNTVETIKEVESGMVLAMTIKDEVPYILDNRGVLSAYNGSFFEEVGRIDLEYKQLYRFDQFSSLNRWIHHNGMQTIDGEILMAINSRMEDTADLQIPRTPSGVYAYNDKVGIYNKFTFSSITDPGSVTDQGQLELDEVGAIYSLLDDEELDSRTDQSDFLVSYSYKEDNSTTRYVIAKSDKRGFDMPEANRASAGVLTTTKWFGPNVTEQWQKFYAFIKPLANSTDKIVLKYRCQEYEPVEFDLTWVDTTSFTTTDADFADVLTNFDADVDYEFEGLQGDGSGFVAHITDISESGGTYTVTLDETITGATTRTAKGRVDRWNKVQEFTDADAAESYIEFNPEAECTWIQFKLYMMGDSVELQRILAVSTTDKETDN